MKSSLGCCSVMLLLALPACSPKMLVPTRQAEILLLDGAPDVVRVDTVTPYSKRPDGTIEIFRLDGDRLLPLTRLPTPPETRAEPRPIEGPCFAATATAYSENRLATSAEAAGELALVVVRVDGVDVYGAGCEVANRPKSSFSSTVFVVPSGGGQPKRFPVDGLDVGQVRRMEGLGWVALAEGPPDPKKVMEVLEKGSSPRLLDEAQHTPTTYVAELASGRITRLALNENSRCVLTEHEVWCQRRGYARTATSEEARKAQTAGRQLTFDRFRVGGEALSPFSVPVPHTYVSDLAWLDGTGLVVFGPDGSDGYLGVISDEGKWRSPPTHACDLISLYRTRQGGFYLRRTEVLRYWDPARGLGAPFTLSPSEGGCNWHPEGTFAKPSVLLVCDEFQPNQRPPKIERYALPKMTAPDGG